MPSDDIFDLALSDIANKCREAIEESSPELQQEKYNAIQNLKLAFVQLLISQQRDNLITSEEKHFLMEELIRTTYDFDKIASRQNFGITLQPPGLPRLAATIDQLSFQEAGATVASANQTRGARLVGSETKVFYKNTRPDIAQLEIVAAEFFRHTLGGSHTSHGRLVTEGQEVRGMYVEAIPGFISMRQLTDLAQHPHPYEKIEEKIAELERKITELSEEISATGSEDEATTQLLTKLQETIKLRATYIRVKDLHLIDAEQHLVDVSKIPSIIAKALCSAFYYEDWDRHKDNFGISYGHDGLEVASLDYDKSFTGTFHQDNKLYDWTITPERLRDFPNFNCWYWPTQNNELRAKSSRVLSRLPFQQKLAEKIPKMYSSAEAEQYARLKDNPDFQRQSHIEWLKLIFIPLELHQLAVQNLATPSCDSRLQTIPATMESKRQSLLNTAIQLNSFRERLQTDPAILDEVKRELEANLSPEEFALVRDNWDATLASIRTSIDKVTAYENAARELGYSQLLVAIRATGISFPPTGNIEDFRKQLKEIVTSGQSAETIRDRLNNPFGLSISKEQARAIKQEMYMQQIRNFSSTLAEMFAENINLSLIKKISAQIGKTQDAIQQLEDALGRYRASSDRSENNPDLKTAILCLRNLGVPSVVSDVYLKDLIIADCQQHRPPSWQATTSIANPLYAKRPNATEPHVDVIESTPTDRLRR